MLNALASTVKEEGAVVLGGDISAALETLLAAVCAAPVRVCTVLVAIGAVLHLRQSSLLGRRIRVYVFTRLHLGFEVSYTKRSRGNMYSRVWIAPRVGCNQIPTIRTAGFCLLNTHFRTMHAHCGVGFRVVQVLHCICNHWQITLP
jgi:hypothetical protein